jgi:hypothetical protein
VNLGREGKKGKEGKKGRRERERGVRYALPVFFLVQSFYESVYK